MSKWLLRETKVIGCYILLRSRSLFLNIGSISDSSISDFTDHGGYVEGSPVLRCVLWWVFSSMGYAPGGPSIIEWSIVGFTVSERDVNALSSEIKKNISRASALRLIFLGPKALWTVFGEKKNPLNMYGKFEVRYATNYAARLVQIQTKLRSMYYDPYESTRFYID